MHPTTRRALVYWTVAVLALGLWAQRWVAQRTRTDLEWQLRERANWSAAWAASQGDLAATAVQSRLVALVESIDPFATALRVTILTPDGAIVADSFDVATLGRSMLDAPDVLAAQARGLGVAYDVAGDWYVTKAVLEDGAARGFVRVRMPAALLQRTLQSQQRWILLGSAVLWVLGVLGGYARLHVRAESPASPKVTSDDSGETFHATTQALLDCLPDGVVIIDAQDRVQYCNAAALRLLGGDDHTCQGRYYWEVVRWPDVHMIAQEVRGATAVVERQVRVRIGESERWLLIRALAFGTAFGLTLHDDTELRRLERVRRDFVANVSHELQTPLMALTGYLELLRDDLPDTAPLARAWTDKMAGQADRLQSLVRSLLQLARAEALPEPELVPTDLVALARDVLARWQGIAQRKTLTLQLETTCAACMVPVDPDGMTQILDNLVANAVRWTTHGGITLRLTETATQVICAVVDTGVGIPPHAQPRVFERFYQVDPARSPDRRGTGLGLAIVKHLVQAQRATITLDSIVGIGSTFTVSFIKS